MRIVDHFIGKIVESSMVFFRWKPTPKKNTSRSSSSSVGDIGTRMDVLL